MSCSEHKKMKRLWFLLLLFLSLSKSVDDDEFAIKIFREGERLEREGEYLAAGDAFYLALTNGYPNLEKAFSRFEKAFLSRGKGEYAYYLIGRGYEAQNDMKNAKSMYRQGLSRSTSLSRMDFVNALESDVSRSHENEEIGNTRRHNRRILWLVGRNCSALQTARNCGGTNRNCRARGK